VVPVLRRVIRLRSRGSVLIRRRAYRVGGGDYSRAANDDGGVGEDEARD
jgi:hypothetical protein